MTRGLVLALLTAPLHAVGAEAFDLRVTFPAPEAACAIELVGRGSHPSGAFYDVTDVTPFAGPTDAVVLSTLHLGQATLLSPRGATLAFRSAVGHILEYLETGEVHGAELRPLIAAAKDFLTGERPGRVFRIKVNAHRRGGISIQAQTLHLLSPDATYPRGLILGWVPETSWWYPLANLRWDRWSALFAEATVADGPDHPGRSYLVTPDAAAKTP